MADKIKNKLGFVKKDDKKGESNEGEEEFKKLDSLSVLAGGAKDLIKKIEETKQTT